MAARRFANFIIPPVAGVAVGWSLWGGAEALAPEQTQQIAASIHGATYNAQQWLGSVSGGALLPAADSALRVQPPLHIAKAQKAQEENEQAGSMFSEIFEQCRLNESLDWLEENVTDDIPFLYINELVAAWGTLYFWKHFLRAPNPSSSSSSEAEPKSAAASSTVNDDLNLFADRAKHDCGIAAVHVTGGDEEKQLLPHRVEIFTGGEAALVEGLWHRFAVTRQLDATAGWSSLAVLTQNPRNAIALAAIALVASEANNQQQHAIAGSKPVFGGSVLQVGQHEVEHHEDRGDRFNVLCSADRCVWALGSLINTGCRIWKDDDNSSVAVVSEQHQKQEANAGAASKTSFLPAFISNLFSGNGGLSEEELKVQRRKSRKPFVVAPQNGDHLGHVRDVLSSMEERRHHQTAQDDNDSHQLPFDVESSRRWAIAGMDPFLVTLRNVDLAVCDFLKEGREKTHHAPPLRRSGLLGYLPYFGYVAGSNEEKNKCVDLMVWKNNSNNEGASSGGADDQSCGSISKQDLRIFQQQQQKGEDRTAKTLVPDVCRYFEKRAPASDATLLREYIGELFVAASESGHVPLSSLEEDERKESSSNNNKKKQKNVVVAAPPLELRNAGQNIERQAEILRKWVSRDE